jgi:hypothetical protein
MFVAPAVTRIITSPVDTRPSAITRRRSRDLATERHRGHGHDRRERVEDE